MGEAVKEFIERFEFTFLLTFVGGMLIVWPIYNWIAS